MNPTHTWETHDNGGRPFIVEEFPSKVIVYKQEFNFDTDSYNPREKLFEQPYKKLYIGDKPKWQEPLNWYSDFKGNSILVKMSKTNYMFIGHEIYEFETKDDDEILEFWSEVGNSDVPYPFAVGTNYVYFFLDHEAIPKDYFSLDKDMYEQYYLPSRINDCRHQPSVKGTELCKRFKKGDKDLQDQLEYLEKHRKKFKFKIKASREA